MNTRPTTNQEVIRKKELYRPILMILCGLFLASRANAGLWDQFIDEKDGMIDMSHYVLDNATGFMPLPIIVTEPALGGIGLGAALAFFHEDKSEKARRQRGEIESPQLPPSVSGFAAAYTANESWLGAGFHQGSYKKDSIRYVGAIGTASINLRFYGRNDGSNISDDGESFEINGGFLFQDLRFRLGQSRFFLGAEYTYLNSEVRFDNAGIPDIGNENLDAASAGAGPILFFDSRDNYFTPESGFDAKLVYSFYRKGLGSDFEFDKFKTNAHAFWMVRDDVQLAVRGDVKAITSGFAPFWEVPYIDLRGIPVLRYQGEVTTVGEVEGRWDLNSRWSINGFLGAGRAADTLSDIENASTRITRGVGFRYLIMRLLKARAGIDIAWGPEEAAVYLTFGSAWSRD